MINTDLSIQKEWIARRGFNNSFTLTFTNNGSAFNVTNYVFVLNVRRIGGTSNVLQLTEGAGITNGGVTGIVTVQLSAENSLLIDADGYYYEINYTVSTLSYGLIHGTLNLIAKYNNENINESTTIEVNLAGTDLSLEINLGASFDTRTRTTTSTATLTPNVSLYDMDVITAQAEALVIDNPIGTPVNGNGYVVRVTDDGNAQAISFDTKFRAFGNGLPTTTVISKTMYIVFVYNSTGDFYDVLNYIEEN